MHSTKGIKNTKGLLFLTICSLPYTEELLKAGGPCISGLHAA